MSREITVHSEGYSFLEGPRWHDGQLFVSDFYTQRVLSIDDSGRASVVAEVPNQPSGTGWLPDGRMLIVSMLDHRILRREPDGKLVEHANIDALVGGHCNDMVVDAAGRAYVGNFGFDFMAGDEPRPTVLVRVDPDGSATVAATDMHFPNGSVIIDHTLVVAESLGNRLTAFDIGADGSLSGRRDWYAFAEPPTTGAEIVVAPDGIGADAEGAIWVADAFHHRVVRVTSNSGIVEEIDTGEQQAYACMLGGADGRTLFVCAAPSSAESERIRATDAQLLAVRVDVPHGGTP